MVIDKMKILRFILLIIFLNNSSAIASERKESELFLYKVMGIEHVVDLSIQDWKDSAVAMTPKLTNDIIENEYNDIFEDTKHQLRERYLISFKIYSDDELKKIVDFYKTDFGKWYSKKTKSYNNDAHLDVARIYENLNDQFFDRFLERNKKL